MATKVNIEAGTPLQAHPLRDTVLGELHARPFTPIETPRRILHFGFLTTAEQPQADREALAKLCLARGLSVAPPGAKHLRYQFDGFVLRWECHAEFTTYTWEFGQAAAAGLPVRKLVIYEAPWVGRRNGGPEPDHRGRLEELVRACGLPIASSWVSDIGSLLEAHAVQPDVVLIDVRGHKRVPSELALLKKQHPLSNVMLLATALEPGERAGTSVGSHVRPA